MFSLELGAYVINVLISIDVFWFFNGVSRRLTAYASGLLTIQKFTKMILKL